MGWRARPIAACGIRFDGRLSIGTGRSPEWFLEYLCRCLVWFAAQRCCANRFACLRWAGRRRLLASCGGGTQLEPFDAQRVLAFGDEPSVITTTGSKYTVNALQTDNVTLDCASNPIWVQTVAASFGLVFPRMQSDQCRRADAAASWPTPGAKVADLAAQVNAHLAGGDSFGPTRIW